MIFLKELQDETTIDINIHHGIILAIRKHIVTEEALACCYIAVCIYPSLYLRVIVPAITVVQSRFGVVEVSAISERISMSNMT